VTSRDSFWHHEENLRDNHDGKKEQLKMSVTPVMEHYQSMLEKEVHAIAWETGAIQRIRKLDAATFAQMLIFGFGPRSRAASKWISTSRKQKRSLPN
jgi:hypothetical protein